MNTTFAILLCALVTADVPNRPLTKVVEKKELAKPAELKPAVDAGVVWVDAGVADAGVKAATMTPEVKDLVDRLQAFYEKTSDFRAGFKQDYTYAAFKRTQTSTGIVTYAKPATMRWEYEKPTARTFVLAGDKVYAHDPEALTLTKASIATNKLSASVTFLWGQGKLADEFSIVKKDCAKCTGVLLEMTPLKPDPRFQRVLLEVDPKTAQVTKSTVIDPDASSNAITFIDLKTNVGVDAGTFKITPPPGTQVIDYTAPKGPPPIPMK